jgi:hypothetical protein
MMTRSLTRSLAVFAVAALFAGCPATPPAGLDDAGDDAGAAEDVGDPGGSDAGPVDCRACVNAEDCGDAGACVQVGGDFFCGSLCAGAACGAGEACTTATAYDGTQVQVCSPASGSCNPDAGCGVCPGGSSCEVSSGTCQVDVDAGSPDAGAVACGTKMPPSLSSCCHSCTPGSGTCQANGCFGGWYCDEALSPLCFCKKPPTSCGSADAGPGFDAGTSDAGPLTGTVTADGGVVSRLYFAVVGDTRPSIIDGTYPTAVITKIYQDIQALNPRPQFVVASGDYMFAIPFGTKAAEQMALYKSAKDLFTGGPVFAAVGNHECTGATTSNCFGNTTSKNYQAFLDTLVKPLGKTLPYYTVPLAAQDGSWTAKLVITACNVWDPGQKAWLTAEFARPTTYTFVVNHEPASATTAPCQNELNALLATAQYNLLIVGHSHTYSHSGKQVIVGTGGAPITGSVPFGFATVEQLPGTGFKVVQYESSTGAPLSSFVVP